MSADNCICILKTPITTPIDNDFEYRVIHTTAIENIFWNEAAGEFDDRAGNPKEVINYFGDCTPMKNEQEAFKLARSMEKEVLEDDFCPILEYGIINYELPHPFSWYIEASKK